MSARRNLLPKRQGGVSGADGSGRDGGTANRKGHAWLGALLLAGLALAACGDEDPPVVQTEAEPYALATTPDQLMVNFALAFNERNYERYDELLHEDFVFFFSPEGGGEGTSWDRQSEMLWVSRLFSGQPGQRPDGTPQPPVKEVQMTLAEHDPGADWIVPAEEPFAGTVMKRYLAEVKLIYAQGSPDNVSGLQDFYAAPVEIEVAGKAPVTVYQLKYWVDLGRTDKMRGATGASSWSQLRAGL